LLKNSLIKAMVYGLLLLLLASGTTSGLLETQNQKHTPNIASENESGYPFVGSIDVHWNGRLLTRPHGTCGYPADRNYSFQVHYGVGQQLSFTVVCYATAKDSLLPIPHLSLFYAEIRDHNGDLIGKASMFNSMKTKDNLNFSMTLNASVIPNNVGDTENFTVTLKGWGWPSILNSIINPLECTYQIWVTYTEEG